MAPVAHRDTRNRVERGRHRVGSAPSEPAARVEFQRVMSYRETFAFAVLLAVVLAFTVRYAIWWLQAGRVPTNYQGGALALIVLANFVPYAALTVLESLRTLQLLVFWVFATFMADAVPLAPARGLRVAVLTTLVPSKEPPEAVEATLAGMSRIRYDGPLDLWILDEEDDSRVREMAARYGVRHFSRHGIERYNQPSGPFTAKTKSGNLNAWRDVHEAAYDVVGQMDSDHVPTPDFLERTLGFFRDPDVAYVVAPQVYTRNAARNWVARGSDEQNFGFSAITQRGGNRLGMPIFIGSNHLCRTATMEQIGGYVSHVVEDHITGMVMLSTTNPATGSRWKGVYCKDIISHGEGPSTWRAYLSQQMRWAFGLFEILRHYSPRILWRMRLPQVVGLLLIQSYYPSVATVFVLGVTLTVLHLGTGLDAVNAPLSVWASYWVPQLLSSMVLWYWMQRFYLTKADRGVGLRGMLLGAGATLIYLHALLQALAGKRLPYVITPKGQRATREPLALFRWHLVVLVLCAAALAYSYLGDGGTSGMLRFWAVLTSTLMGLVILSGLLARPEGAGPERRQAGGNYWLRVAVPAGALVLFVGMPLVEQRAPRAIAGAEQASAGGPADTSASAPVRAAALAALPAVHAAFLNADGEAVAFGAYGPEGAFAASAKIDHLFVDFDPARVEEMAHRVRRAAEHGQVALITWEPRRGGVVWGPPMPSDVALLDRLASGDLDAYVRDVARTLRDSGQPVVLRFAHEMDHERDGLHPWAGAEPEGYRAAWRRVHEVFQEERAENVRFMWSPGGVITPWDGWVSGAWYPGDDVVDMVGFSAFAAWQWEEWSAQRASVHAFRSPRELLQPRYEAIAAYGKPVLLPEVGVAMHPTRAAAEAEWLSELARLATSGEMPLLCGVVYFNAPHNLPNYAIDWRLDAHEVELLGGAGQQRPWLELAVR